MIMYSTRARVAGYLPDVVAWGAKVAQLGTKVLGVQVDCASRVGGHQDMVWVSRWDSLAALDAALLKLGDNADYLAMVKTAVEKGYFDPGSIEYAIWRLV